QIGCVTAADICVKIILMSNITRDKYRKFLLESLIELEETIDNLNLIILNLTMAGEWKEIDAMFEVGETLHTKFEDLRSISDANVKKLIAATDELATVF